MVKKTVVSAVALVVLMLAGSAAVIAAPAEEAPATVGDLAVRLAGEMQLKPEGPDAEAARAALAAAGVQVTGDLARTLREKDVTEVLNQLGLRLTTSQPDRTVDRTKIGRLLDLVFQAPATEGAGGDSTSDRGNNPPGGGFGRSKSQASPHNG